MYRLSLILCVALTSTAAAQRGLKKSQIPDPNPELERKTFQIAPGFEVNLFAGDPRIAKPIHMNFDVQGRLWIASSSVYPHIKPGKKATDKILVIEDTNGDGKGNRTTVFADNLLIPTGIVPGDGGVYVVNSTELLFLKDTNGDGKADYRRIVLSGFGAEDTHHLLHTLRWGPDGALYMNQSIYIHSHVETPSGVKHLNGGGIWRFRPETMELDVVCHGFVNPWGHHFDRWGQSFATDGAYGEGINYVFPGAVYVASPGRPRRLRGLNPGSPKHCGLEILSGRHLPKSVRGSMVTNDFRAHRVCRFVVSEDGAGYASRQEVELIKTKHLAFRPIDAKMGPDGAIYIADWYNPIIQHGEVDFRDPRRDHVHGRIWRITAKGRPLLKKPNLLKASNRELLDHLKVPEQWVRLNAKLILKHRPRKAAYKELKDWLSNLDSKDPQYWHHQLEGLWACQCLQVVDQKLLTKILLAPDPRVRAAGVRVLSRWRDKLPAKQVNHLLSVSLNHRHPRVRLEAVRALAKHDSAAAAGMAARVLQFRMDRFLDFALSKTMRQLQDHWVGALQKNKLVFERAEHMIYALRSSNHPAAMPSVLALIQGKSGNAVQKLQLLQLVGRVGNRDHLTVVVKWLLAQKASDLQFRAMSALIESSVQRRLVPRPSSLSGLSGLIESKNPALQVVGIRAAAYWRMPGVAGRLKQVVTRSPSQTMRHAAMEGLAHLGGKNNTGLLRQLSRQSKLRQDRIVATRWLANLDLPGAANSSVRLLADSKDAAETAKLVSAVLRRKGGALALSKELKGKRLPVDVAKRSLRAVQLSATPNVQLIAAVRSAGQLAAAKWKLTPAFSQALVKEVRESGNAARGEAIYRRRELQCMKCHAVAGSGGKVGPDLISLGASAQVDYLIESLIDPNKKVKENFHSLVIQTDKGTVITGIPVRQSKEVVVLRTAEGKMISIPTISIDLKQQGRSLMAEGSVDGLTRRELVDLTRFLSELGKLGKFAVGKSEIARTWEALLPTKAGLFRIRRSSFDSVAKDDKAFSWEPAYSQVSGSLPLVGLPVLKDATYVTKRGRSQTVFVRCRVAVTTAGKVNLAINSPLGLSLWIDGRPVPMKKSVMQQLTRGTHVIAISIDRTKRSEPLNLQLFQVDGSKAQAKFVR